MKKVLILLPLCLGFAAAQDLDQIDMTMGEVRHQLIAQSTPFIAQGETYDKLKRVFDNLTKTESLQSYRAPYLLFFTGEPFVNAYSTWGGHLYVTDGLMCALNGDEGMLAFCMGHEMGHVLRQHAAKKYLRAVMYQQTTRAYAAQCRAGVNASCWANVAYQAAYLVAEKKQERDNENEADQIGMMGVAEAGYHPDFAILAARRLRDATGEQSKFAAFFSDHPRWTTREERAEKNYDSALAVFTSRWPSVESSPGGRTPAMARMTQVKVEKGDKVRQVQTSIWLRNLQGPVALKAMLVGEHGAEPVAAFSSEYLADVSAQPILFEITDQQLKGRKGHQFVQIEINSTSERLLVEKPIKVK